MRRSLAVAAAIVPLTILLAACGNAASSSSGSDSSASSTASSSTSAPAANAALLSSVKLTPTSAGKAPKVEFTKPLAVPQPAIKVVTQGTGAEIKDGQLIAIHTAFFAVADGKVLADNFSKAASSIVIDSSFKTNNPLIYGAVVGAKVGSEIAYATPASTQSGQTQAAQLLIFRIESAKAAPTKASSDEVAKLDSEGKLPTVSFNAKAVPSVKIPSGAAPDNLIVKVLKEGTGDALQATDSIKANYTGWSWSTSKQFDSSYDKGQPVTFALNQVIPGWTQGLTGQKIGSTVLLVIPSTMAYGDDTTSGQPAGPLVFVVDIVGKG